MLRTAWSQIRTHPARIVAVGLAIVLGIGFAAATVVFTATFDQHLAHTVSAASSRADVVVLPGEGGEQPGPALAAIRAVPGVASAELLPAGNFEYTAARSHGSISLDSIPAVDRLRWFTLAQGRWPVGPAEILVDRSTASGANLPVGSTIALAAWDGAGGVTATVVGIADTSSSALSGAREQAFALPSTITALGAGDSVKVAVLGEPGTDPAQLAGAIGSATAGLTVRTGSEQAATEIAQLGGNTTVLATVLLAFAVIALVVAGIVIANTFTILLTQRRRQIALLRCIGATTSQVRRQVLAEAALIGVLGSAAGIGTGIGVGLLAARLAGLDSAGPAVDPALLAAVFALGIGMTVLAAWLPATRAMRIAPLAALRPTAEAPAEQRVNRIRTLAGAALVLVGGAGLAYGIQGGSLPAALGGGAVSALGILALTRTFLPPLLRVFGRIAPVAGVPGRLAAANAARNPGRAAATSAALLVGVGLIVTLQVAAASASATLQLATAQRYPVDVSVSADHGTVPAGLAGRVAAQPGLEGVTAIPGTTARARGFDSVGAGFSLLGVPEAALPILRGGAAELADDVLVVPGWWLGSGVADGDRITVTVADRHADFTVTAGHLGEAGAAGNSAVITAAALHDLDPQAAPVAVWAGLTAGADTVAVTSALNELIAPDRELRLTGAASERAATDSVLGTLVTLATGLLAVAVVIAIVGIGNTVGLSVIERTRESALLRALGLRRGQLRGMLAVEAGLLALVGAVVGIAVGVFYGWAGASATLAQAGRPLVFTVPWTQILLVLGIALLAGLLAAVLPGRRAARAAPVDALAET